MTEHAISGRVDFGSDATIRTATFGPSEPSMTSEECVAHGGHCHDRTGVRLRRRAASPMQYEERCKHCGHVRWAIPQDPYRYEEDR